jgi:hypothetical protein
MNTPISSVRTPVRQQEVAMLHCPVCVRETLYEQARTSSGIYFGCYTCQGTSDFKRDAHGRTRETFLVARLQLV